MTMHYGLTIPRMNCAYEDAWKEAGIKFKIHSVGGGSTEWTFDSIHDKNEAREIAASLIIGDFDYET